MERKGPAQAGIPCLELITHSRTDSLYDEVAHILLKREHTAAALVVLVEFLSHSALHNRKSIAHLLPRLKNNNTADSFILN